MTSILNGISSWFRSNSQTWLPSITDPSPLTSEQATAEAEHNAESTVSNELVDALAAPVARHYTLLFESTSTTIDNSMKEGEKKTDDALTELNRQLAAIRGKA